MFSNIALGVLMALAIAMAILRAVLVHLFLDERKAMLTQVSINCSEIIRTSFAPLVRILSGRCVIRRDGAYSVGMVQIPSGWCFFRREPSTYKLKKIKIPTYKSAARPSIGGLFKGFLMN